MQTPANSQVELISMNICYNTSVAHTVLFK